MTTFIGRERVLREARDLLGASRLVTVTGAGGIGKTRLATELVERVDRAYADGVTVVELAAVEDGADVAAAVAAALAVPDQSTRSAADQIARHLAGRRTLLMVDNCEHLLAEVAELLGGLLDAVDGLSVLATSREPLGLPGEQIYPLGPLSVPQSGADPATVDATEAVRLLTERARSFLPGFAVTDENRAAVVQLCDRLDGMPLAIELAAVRLRSLSVAQVVARLDHRFTLLTGGARSELPRHRTLWDLVDWSHELCGPDERLLWARLSVFPGTFDLEAAEAVGGSGELAAGDVLDVLDRLVAKSIVNAETSGAAMRYRLLVSIREYGARRLEEAGERAETRRRHRDHYLARAATMVRDWCGPRQPDALAAMRRDHANLLAALEWSASTPGQEQRAAELGALLRYHWIAGGQLSDGRRWLDRILALDPRPTPERGAAAWVAAWVALIQGDRTAAAGHLATCREVAGHLGDAVLTAHADHWTGLLHLFSGDTGAAIEALQCALAVFDREHDDAALQTALFQLAMAQTYHEQTAEALATCRRVLALSDERGEQWCRAYSLWVTGICQWRRGDRDAAAAAARAALELQREFQDGICIALTLDLMSWLACAEDHAERAAALAGGADAVWRLLGTTVDAFGPHLTEDSRAGAREINRSLGRPAADQLRSAQQDLDRLAAVALGLGSARTPPAQRPRTGPLTGRELEVAELIAAGLSNRAIAERLVLSPRTVDGHVERILAKLEFSSRTQVATWFQAFAERVTSTEGGSHTSGPAPAARRPR